MMQNKPSNKEIISAFWHRGLLKYKLDPVQKELYDLYYNAKHKTMVWLLSRRSGKSFSLCVLAIEQCLKKPNSIVKFLSPTKRQVEINLRPLFRTILEDCPDELKPDYKNNQQIYYFPNGSEIQLSGTDGGHAETLRGGDSDICIVDEAGSCDDLEDIIKDILLPTTLITKGKIILASTPPKRHDHDFIKFIEDAELKGSLVKKTVYDNPRITKEQLEELITELGGIHTESARRELMCEIVKDSNTSVIPEFTPELEKEVIKEWPRPPFFDCYVSMDLGGKDLTAVLFGYFDFRAYKLVIEDELIMDFNKPDSSIKKLTEEITNKEGSLFLNILTNELKEPNIRISDINPIVVNEILKYSHGKLTFATPRKDDKDAAIHDLRVMISSKKIIINPKCQTLIRHLRNVKWDRNRSKFSRSPDDGHYDTVDALIYMIRSISFNKNPYPAHYGYSFKDMHVQNPNNFYKQDPMEAYRKMFGIKRKKSYGA